MTIRRMMMRISRQPLMGLVDELAYFDDHPFSDAGSEAVRDFQDHQRRMSSSRDQNAKHGIRYSAAGGRWGNISLFFSLQLS